MKTIGTILDALRPSVDAELYDDVHQIINDGFRTVEKLREQNADLRQHLEDTESLLIIARATETAMQDELAAKDAEIKRLNKQLDDFRATFDALMMRFS